MNGIMGAILAFFQLSQVALMNRHEDTAKPTWSCNPLNWIESAQVSNGMFTGAVQANCTFEAQSGQGFTGLRGYIVEKTEKSKQIHQGPKSEIYQKLDSLYYEVTHEMKFGDSDIEVRADVHIASNLETTLIYDVFSKSIHATGQAGYLKKFDIQTQVQSTADKSIYELVLVIRPKVKKPIFVPAGYFRDELKKQIEKVAPDVERSVIKELQDKI